MSIPFSLPDCIDLEEVMASDRDERYEGWCLACGSSQSGVEPDAEGYRCESCGRLEVYGAEQILILYGD